MTPLNFDDLESAFLWVSGAGPFENSAYVSRVSGKIYWDSDSFEREEELPDDIEDGTLYIAVPHKNDLELGRSLVFEFVERYLPTKLTESAHFSQGAAPTRGSRICLNTKIVSNNGMNLRTTQLIRRCTGGPQRMDLNSRRQLERSGADTPIDREPHSRFRRLRSSGYRQRYCHTYHIHGPRMPELSSGRWVGIERTSLLPMLESENEAQVL